MLTSAERSVKYPLSSEEVVFHHYVDGVRQPPDHDSVQYIPIEAYSPRFERITPNSTGSRRAWKSFQHYLSAQVTPSPRVGWNLTGGRPGMVYAGGYYQGLVTNPWVGYYKYYPYSHSARYGDMGRLDASLPTFYEPEADGSFVPPPDDLNNLTQRALSTMLPIIKAELSVPNFILELKDFKRPASKIVSLVRSPLWKWTLRIWARQGLQALSWKQLLRTTAGQYLNYKFNLRPLVSDISKIYLAMSRTERRINDFITRAGKPQNKHFCFKWQEFEDEADEVSVAGTYHDQFGGGSQCGCSRQVFYEPSAFHAQIQYNYNYTGYQVEHARLLATLDALGINLNPAIIWNAIPWSFTVDWVLGVSRWLDTLKTENMRPQINIRRFLWSIKRSRKIVVSKGVRSIVPLDGIIQNQMPVVYQTAYRREVKLPSSSSITSSGLSPEEFSLGAALVIARRRRFNNRGRFKPTVRS